MRVCVLSRSAFLYHGFLSPEECEHIKDVARPRMERSMVRANTCSTAAALMLPLGVNQESQNGMCAAAPQVVDPDTGGEKMDDIRTSFGTFLAKGETEMIRAIEARVAEWSQVPDAHQEQLQILRCVLAALLGASRPGAVAAAAAGVCSLHVSELMCSCNATGMAWARSIQTTGTGSTTRRWMCAKTHS